jgi:Spy/CpxP family protein refolding chaperone
MTTQKRLWIKYVFAGIGAVYLVLFAAYILYAAMREKAPTGPSELELHPERQAAIRARERAEELRERLTLSEEQTRKISDIFARMQPEAGTPEGGDRRERFRLIQEEIGKILTPEQRALQEQMGFAGPGRPGGPGGPGRRGGPFGMNPERMEELQKAMTPEQKERFEKRMERMRERMPFGPRGNRGPGHPGPDGPPPGGPPPDGPPPDGPPPDGPPPLR